MNHTTNIVPFSTTQKKIDKSSRMPAYVQLADILRASISNGDYPPGARIPAESELAKSHGLSAMTARQAVSVLEEEGLVRRIQGMGTYVQSIRISSSSFGLTPLGQVFSDAENLSVRIISAKIQKSPGKEKEILELSQREPVTVVERVIHHKKQPFTFHVTYTRFEPKSPTVESMLDTVVLTDLIFREGYSMFKRGKLQLLPSQVDDRVANLLDLNEGQSVFKLEHLFYDFSNKPAAFGWFILCHGKMPLISRVGIWDDE